MTAHELKVIVGWAAAYGAIAGLGVVCALGLLLEWACRAIRRWRK